MAIDRRISPRNHRRRNRADSLLGKGAVAAVPISDIAWQLRHLRRCRAALPRYRRQRNRLIS